MRKKIPLERFDPATGWPLETYPSYTAAEQAGYNRGAIDQCVRGKRSTHHGCGWRVAGSGIFTSPPTSQQCSKDMPGLLRIGRPIGHEIMRRKNSPICQIDPTTKEVVATYAGIADACAYGFAARDIRRVLDGAKETADGYGWRLEAELRAPGESSNALTAFVAAHVHHVPGSLITFKEFYAKFLASLPEADRRDWSHIRVSRSLPDPYETGTATANRMYVVNAAWEPLPSKGRPYRVTKDGKARQN